MEKENTKKTRHSFKQNFNPVGFHKKIKPGTYDFKRHTYITYYAKTQEECDELSQGLETELSSLLSGVDETSLSTVEKTELLINVDESEYPYLHWYVHNITKYSCENYINFISGYVDLSVEGRSEEKDFGPWKIDQIKKINQRCIDNGIDTFLNKDKAKYIWETSLLIQIILTQSIHPPSLTDIFNVKPPNYLEYLKRTDYTGKSEHEYANKCRDWRKKQRKQQHVKDRRETKKSINY